VKVDAAHMTTGGDCDVAGLLLGHAEGEPLEIPQGQAKRTCQPRAATCAPQHRRQLLLQWPAAAGDAEFSA
jgi:hypothetical protein